MCPFSLMCPHCLKLMQGKKKPLYFKFVFLLSPANQLNTVERAGTSFLPEDVSGMYLHFTYKNETLTCPTESPTGNFLWIRRWIRNGIA